MRKAFQHVSTGLYCLPRLQSPHYGSRCVSMMSAIKRGISHSDRGKSQLKSLDNTTARPTRFSKPSATSRPIRRSAADGPFPFRPSRRAFDDRQNVERSNAFGNKRAATSHGEGRNDSQHAMREGKAQWPNRSNSAIASRHQRKETTYKQDRRTIQSTPTNTRDSRPNSSFAQRQDSQPKVLRNYEYDAKSTPKENRRSPGAQQIHPFEASELRITRNSIQILRSTAASEFIYGRSSVIAALKSGKRKFYNLYLSRMSEGEQEDSADQLNKLAMTIGVKISWLSGVDGVSQMDRITKGRPHNGVILEASPLPRLPVSGLEEAFKGKPFNVQLRSQNKDEENINGSDEQVPLNSKFPRYPFVVMLDEIVDQGNLGGILRSAYFLGADAVVLSSHMAIVNAVTLKAASGAAENIRILSVHNTTGFLETSKDNGWTVYAAVAPPAPGSSSRVKHRELHDLGHPLDESPCILLLGGEGDGLRRDLVRKADRTISIPGQESRDSGVDSLNVSVAAGILINEFLKSPARGAQGITSSPGASDKHDSNILF